MFYICSYGQRNPEPRSRRSPVRSASSPRPVRRGATSLKKARREERIISLLNRGVSAAEIAAREGLSLKRVHNLVREMLAQRMPGPPAEFVALQVSRLSEALLVSYSAMHSSTTGANFEAIDRVIRIVRELDRYHGFALAARPREEPEPRRLPPPVESPIALEAPIAERLGNGAATD
jgi:DNA-binding CsgD family transcriptional regulator